MAAALLKLVFVLVVTQITLSNVNAIKQKQCDKGKTDSAFATNTPCFLDPILQLLKEIGLEIVGNLLQILLCPAKKTSSSYVEKICSKPVKKICSKPDEKICSKPVKKICSKPDEKICPNIANWNPPKIFIGYPKAIGLFDLVDGNYSVRVGSDIPTEKYPTGLTTNKAGDKIFAFQDYKIVVYTRKSCSYEFEMAYATEKIPDLSFQIILDPSEKFLIMTKLIFDEEKEEIKKEAIFSYKLEPNGSMTEADLFEPPTARSSQLRELAFIPKSNIVAVLSRDDEVQFYNFDSNNGKLNAAAFVTAKTRKYSGPSSLAFSPDGMFMYVLGKNKANIIVFKAEIDENKKLTEFISVQEIPCSNTNNATSKSSELNRIRIHPNGTFLYALIYGFDSISIFKINRVTGRLAQIDSSDTKVDNPITFIITPKGDQLIITYNEPNRIIAYDIDSEGKLSNANEISGVDDIPYKIAYSPDTVE